MKSVRKFAGLAIAAMLTGCLSGQLNYVPPTAEPTVVRTTTMPRPRQDVWKTLVPRLGQTFFVINTMDQSSGLVNLSYSGDPEKYVDCGIITSSVSNARGSRKYSFPGSRAHSDYEVKSGSNLFGVTRTMSLDGRANIILEELSATTTRVTVNIRYIVQRTLQYRDMMGRQQSDAGTVSFNSGARAAFANGVATTCQATGLLEQELLDLVRP